MIYGRHRVKTGAYYQSPRGRALNFGEFAEVGQGIGHIGFIGLYVFKGRLLPLGDAASRPSSGEPDKIVLAHPLQDQKYG